MTVSAEKIAKLKCLLANTLRARKHSAYQSLADSVAQLLGDDTLALNHKNEAERLVFMESYVDFRGLNVLDIGCNSGFFMFELLQRGAARVTGYEGSVEHAQFVSEAASLLDVQYSLEVRPQYFDFQSAPVRFDVALLLNVLHHVGDDYGDPTIDIEQARTHMLRQLNQMSQVTNRLVFQLGFNWRGDAQRCLFQQGTKAEMIEFVREGTRGVWNIDAIGVAARQAGRVIYSDVNLCNIARDDSLGEFLNRPIFIMTSLAAEE